MLKLKTQEKEEKCVRCGRTREDIRKHHYECNDDVGKYFDKHKYH